MSDKKTLYVSRRLKNANEFIDWAKAQGFKTTLEADDLHVTIAFSREPVDWDEITPDASELNVAGGKRTVEPLGDKGAVVLKFASKPLSKRWKQLIDDYGASWDHDGYHPHVTITYDGGDVSLESIESFTDALLFEDERFEAVAEDWEQQIAEKSVSGLPLRLFLPITKIDEDKRTVYGVLTEECADKSGEIFDYASGKPAVQAWSDEIKEASGGKSLGNVRAMHDKIAAGKFTEIIYDDDNKRIEGAAKIVDADEWAKVIEGVYTGFSIGGSYVKRWKDPNDSSLWRFTPELSEISLVDNPCVPTATFEYIKADGSVEMRKFTLPPKEDSMDPKAVNAAREALAKGTATDEQKALIVTADAELLKSAQDALAKGEATDEQKALLAKVAGEAKPDLVKDGKPVKPKTAPVQKNVWLAADESEHPSKREAEIHNLHIEKQAELAPALGKMDALLKSATPAVDDDADGDGDDEATKVAKAARRDKKAADKVAADKAAADELAKQAAKDAAKPGTEPAPVNKTATPKKLTKGLHQIGWLANLLSDLQCLQGSVEWEQMWEQDTSSELPGKFKTLVAQMCEVLVALVNEETSELIAEGTDIEVEVMEMAAKMAPSHATALAKLIKSDKLKAELEKAGARHSKSDKDALMAIHKSAYDHADAIDKCMKDMGVMDDDGEDKDAKKMSKLLDMLQAERDNGSALTKVLTGTNESLQKAIPVIESLQKQNADLVARMEHLEKQPAAPKGHVRAISKTQDGGAGGETEAEYKARLAKMNPDEHTRELMKLAMSKPIEMATSR